MLSLEKNCILKLNLFLLIDRYKFLSESASVSWTVLAKVAPRTIYPAYLPASKILHITELQFKANNHFCQFALKHCSWECKSQPEGKGANSQEQKGRRMRSPSSEVSAQAGLLETCPVLSAAAKSNQFPFQINSLNASVIIKYMGS